MQVARIRGICLTTLSRAIGLPVCTRCVRQHHVLVDESRLYARDMSDNIFLRMQVARMREICRTALSRG